MIAKESLRIGNLILAIGSLTKGCIHVVTGIDANMVYMGNVALSYGNIGGIPLTEEWLKKCGFVFHQSVGSHYIAYNGLRLSLSFFRWDASEGYLQLDSPLSSTEIRFVHQLQNWFHGLTGQELTIQQFGI